MKGTFRSSDYVFRPTQIAAAMAGTGVVASIPLVREARYSVNGRDFHVKAA